MAEGTLARPGLGSPRGVLRWLARLRLGLDELVTALLAFMAFGFAFSTTLDFDYWWHLANGRFIVGEHRLPEPDPFSFTAAGHAWTAHEWLIEVGMYGLHQAFGIGGTQLVFALAFVATVLLLLVTLRAIGVRQLTATMWLGLFTLACVPFLGPRPNVVTTLLLAGVLWLLERWVRRRDRSIWLLPLLLFAWANLHGSFVVGLAVPVLLLAGEQLAAWFGWPAAARLEGDGRRRLALATAVAVAAAALNAHGPALYLFPFSAVGDPDMRKIVEWQALDVSEPSMWAFVLLAGGYVALLAVRRPRVPASDLVLAAAFIGAAFWAVRFVPLAATCLVLVIGRVFALPNGATGRAPRPIAALARWRDDRARRYADLPPVLQLANAVALAALLVAFARAAAPYDPAEDERLPVAAVEQLRSAPPSGPLFNEFGYGGYLIWRVWPETRVFIDGRQHDLYAPAGVLGEYIDVITVSDSADRILDERGIQTVLFKKDHQLTRYLLATGRWTLAYDDGQVVRLERSGAAGR